MTIKEFYEWAKKKKIENYIIKIFNSETYDTYDMNKVDIYIDHDEKEIHVG